MPHFNLDLVQSQEIKNLFKQIPEYRDCLKPFNLILTGKAGTGKTSIALALAELIGADLLKIALKHGRADMGYLDRIDNFAHTQNLNWMETGNLDDINRPKVVLLDEIDLIPTGCIPLRSLLNDHSGKIFFIGTCNSTVKIDASVLSRFQKVEIKGDDLRQTIQHSQIKTLLCE
ncbi:AAA family ATPase [Aeromonas hydrophila]|uniref:AAA family ATPase n=1 Tax=Aeromonas hydrophila TaxID=644 RepID=UPI00208DF5DA|nr:AAA family ATPase [Aeromonas hydrophila]MCO4201217.1 AAA family ATPase [Aeromonas hydrophila]